MTVSDIRRVMIHLRRCEAGLEQPRPEVPFVSKAAAAELAMLRRLVLALAERVAIQSELLARAAERGPRRLTDGRVLQLLPAGRELLTEDARNQA